MRNHPIHVPAARKAPRSRARLASLIAASALVLTVAAPAFAARSVDASGGDLAGSIGGDLLGGNHRRPK
jgi:hypothetical protein